MTTCMFAYLDPGAGAILLQVLLAGLLTAGVVFRRFVLFPFQLLRKPRPDSPVKSELPKE